MTVGARRATRNLARGFTNFPSWDLESALLAQRSPVGADLIAAILGDDLDTSAVVRLARATLTRDRRAAAEFARLKPERLSSLGRVLLLTGEPVASDQGLDVLRAQVMIRGVASLSVLYRNLLVEALVTSGRVDEAADAIASAEFSDHQRKRLQLGLSNPFSPTGSQRMPVPTWVALFNQLMSPSGELAPVWLDDAIQGAPFDRLASAPLHRSDGPLVSVVMSAFRPGETIVGAVRSILNQSWRSLELLVVDDASGPEFDPLLDRVAALDPRVRVVRQRVNGGTYLVRNRAITLARGQFITFQDSDDWSHPERIERQVGALLEDPKMIANQSWCFRTDDNLNPVQVGHHKYKRRNESSLMFRSQALRRIGFFHYTRKGGDSEYRHRLQAAYRHELPVVGDDSLALIRLTPDSLSRSEFSPGFRHPRRLVYSQGFAFAHARAAENHSYYWPLHEYRDGFVPASFQPRRPDTASKKVDVIVVADLRTCAAKEPWITSTVQRFNDAGISVGLAQCTGIHAVKRTVDRIAPEVTALFADGVAEPMDFEEIRRVSAVVVADAALMQHVPWGAGRWHADHVLVQRPPLPEGGAAYDDTTVAQHSLHFFGVEPTWITGHEDGIVQITLSALAEDSSHAGSTTRPVVISGGLPDGAARGGPSGRQRWWWEIDTAMVTTAVDPGSGFVRGSRDLPWAVARDDDSERWCALAGWPTASDAAASTTASLARDLLMAWTAGVAEFDQRYAELSGDCVVIRGVQGDLYVRATCGSSVQHEIDLGRLRVGPSNGESDQLQANSDELVLTAQGLSHRNPLQAEVEHHGLALDTLQHLITREVRTVAARGVLHLDDDADSATWLGLLRDRLADFDVIVRSARGRVSRFLDDNFVDYVVDATVRSSPSPLCSAHPRSVQDAVPMVVRGLGTSLRARALARSLAESTELDDLLEEMWRGLSSVFAPRAGSESLPAARAGGPRLAVVTSLGSGVQDLHHVDGLQLPPNQTHRVGTSPDLARGERFLLSGVFVRGGSSRLVVTLAGQCFPEDDGFPSPEVSSTVFPEHHLVLADTTFADSAALEYGWFFGDRSDDLVLRWAALLPAFLTHLGCNEVVVRGEGASALPAVLLASYLKDCTALVSNIEVRAGDALPSQFLSLSQLLQPGLAPAALQGAHDDRLTLAGLLSAAPPDLRLVLTDHVATPHGLSRASMVFTDRRISTYPGGAGEWLRETAGPAPLSTAEYLRGPR